MFYHTETYFPACPFPTLDFAELFSKARREGDTTMTNQTQGIAYEDLMKPDEDWRNLPDNADRRRIQNRLAQRAYRRNLRERNQEVEQLKQKVRELEDAARGTPSATANELAPTNTRANAPWDVSRAPTHLEEMHFTGEPMPTNNSLSHQSSISGQSSTVQSHGNANMDDLAFFTSFEDHMQMQSTPNLNPTDVADHPNQFSISQDRPSIPIIPQQQNPPQATQTQHPNSSSISGSDPTELETSVSTSSRATSSSASSARSSTRRHTRCTSTNNSNGNSNANPNPERNPCNQTDPNPNINVPRPSLSLIHLAIAAGNADTLRLLLQDLDLRVNGRDRAGYTPLQRAIMSGRTDLVTVLLENGAGPATEDESSD